MVMATMDCTECAHSLETFAGKARYTAAKREAGLNALTFEYDDDPTGQNFLSDAGFITVLYMASACPF